MTDYAVVVGISDYPQFRSLQGPIEDAERVAEWLVDATVGGGVALCEKVLSAGQPPPGRPLGHEIDAAIQRVIVAARADGAARRRLYFYFAGHGFSNGPMEVALCTVLWSKDFRASAISARKYQEALIAHGLFDEIVIWLDCCRTPEIGGEGQGPSNPPPAATARPGGTKVFVAYATEMFSSAFEGPQPAAGPSPVVQGFFTSALLAGLWGAAADAPGGVKADALAEYLVLETPLIAQDARRPAQNPEISNGLIAAPRFGKAPASADVTITVSAARPGPFVLEDSSLNEVLNKADHGPWQVSLTRGRYTLRDVTTSDQLPFSFRPTKGGQHVQF